VLEGGGVQVLIHYYMSNKAVEICGDLWIKSLIDILKLNVVKFDPVNNLIPL
jgi:hypothetical protein